MFDLFKKCYNKTLPGAVCRFRPKDINEYADDAWDIRVSIGDAPLEEAFYITIEDPDAVRKSIKELLDEYVLNPKRKNELDIVDYPELPFLQQQLIEYFKSADDSRLKIDLFINNHTGTVNSFNRAETLLSTCVYDDHSNDYRVLDLIILPHTEAMNSMNKTSSINKHAKLYLLMLLDYHQKVNETAYSKLCSESTIAAYLGDYSHKGFLQTQSGLRDLESSGFIKKTKITEQLTSNKISYQLEITPAGHEHINEIEDQTALLIATYNYYDSVSVAPPALGVPDGFDVRVQMMEYDDIDLEEAVLMCVLAECKDDFFKLDSWEDNFSNALFMETVQEALAFKTSFSVEILQALKSLASG